MDATSRPEGARGLLVADARWSNLVRRSIALIAAYFLAAFLFEQAPTRVADVIMRVTLVLLAALGLSWSLEALVLRKFPTLWLGSLIIGGWWLYVFWQTGDARDTMWVPFIGLLLAALTPEHARQEATEREDVYLEVHPSYASVRRLVPGWIFFLSIGLLSLSMLAGLYSLITK